MTCRWTKRQASSSSSFHPDDPEKRPPEPLAGSYGVRASVMAALCLLVMGCTPAAHTIRPYSDDPQEAKALEREAGKACLAVRKGRLAGISAFTTDGCTLYPDGEWAGCCIAHDIRYWCGGSARDRENSDTELRNCVAEKGFPRNGWLMYWGVRLGAHPLLPFPWRWGYGWPWPKGYEDLEGTEGTGP